MVILSGGAVWGLGWNLDLKGVKYNGYCST
jgi:hypothetical protein